MRLIYACLAASLLVVSIASSATAQAPYPRAYGGKTSQGMPISLKVAKNGHSVKAKLEEGIPCPALGFGYSGISQFTTRLPASRKFAGGYDETFDLPDDPAVGAGDLAGKAHHDVRATLGRTSASGAWHTHMTILDGSGNPVTECDTGRVSFRIKPAGAAIFSSARLARAVEIR